MTAKIRWASASKIGTAHLEVNGELQDAYIVAPLSNNFYLALVADGAGSAKYGKYGAWITCRRFCQNAREFSKNGKLPTSSDIEDWIDAIRDELCVHAERRKEKSREFATTIAGVIFNETDVTWFSVGDSAVVARRDGDWEVLCWPENGEYASTTYFLTDNPSPRLHVTNDSNQYSAFCLFTDGIADIAISYNENCAHKPFFDAMIASVDKSDGDARLPDLSKALKNWLCSEKVCERVDDDKTLILLSTISNDKAAC